MAEQRAQAEQERWARTMQVKAAEDSRRREEMLARLRQANMAKLVISLAYCIESFQHEADYTTQNFPCNTSGTAVQSQHLPRCFYFAGVSFHCVSCLGMSSLPRSGRWAPLPPSKSVPARQTFLTLRA